MRRRSTCCRAAIEADPSFVVAHYTLGVVHSGARQPLEGGGAVPRLDAARPDVYPEPYKALGDLFLSQPRRLFDQAIEAYSKAIELRPFFADALRRARRRQRRRRATPTARSRRTRRRSSTTPSIPRVHMSLGQDLLRGEGALLRVGDRVQEAPSTSIPTPSRRAWDWARYTRTRGSTRRPSRSTGE